MTTTLTDTLLKLVWQDGYSIGESMVYHRGQLLSYIDAAKDGQRWRVLAPDRYAATCELMQQLGWDLEDG